VLRVSITRKKLVPVIGLEVLKEKAVCLQVKELNKIHLHPEKKIEGQVLTMMIKVK